MLSRSLLALIAIPVFSFSAAQAQVSLNQYKSGSVVQVPGGNLNSQMPTAPKSSILRREASRSSIEGKYRKIFSLLSSDRRIRKQIANVSRLYGVDSVLIYGAIIGEHSFNYNVLDSAQGYAQMAMTYFSQLRSSGRTFTNGVGGLSVMDYLAFPEVSRKCGSLGSDYDFWSCAENLWNSQYRGRTVHGYRNSKHNFNEAFFNPFNAGQTYGLGQLSPLAALKVNDVVARKGGLSKISAARPEDVYKAIMDTDTSLHYVAATIRVAVDAYRQTAKFDITTNPGVVATLYNLGREKSRAYASYQSNLKSLARGSGLTYPEENFVGWLVNTKVDEIRSIAR